MIKGAKSHSLLLKYAKHSLHSSRAPTALNQHHNKSQTQTQTQLQNNLESVSGSNVISKKTARQLPASKFNAAMAVSQMPMTHKYKFSHNDGSPETVDPNMPLMTPRTKTGQYRMCMLCYVMFCMLFIVLYLFCFV